RLAEAAARCQHRVRATGRRGHGRTDLRACCRRSERIHRGHAFSWPLPPREKLMSSLSERLAAARAEAAAAEAAAGKHAAPPIREDAAEPTAAAKATTSTP